MLTKRIRKFFGTLRDSESGNALLLMAMGMPVLIGASGFAVDISQWYMWKRELQYAADQGALAGAWASSDPISASSYDTRAKQEFAANLSQLSSDGITPTIAKADYGAGTQNSVTVSASVTRSLPFSQMIMHSAATVSVSSQASFEAATNWTACVLAVDPTAGDSLVLGGSSSGTVGCGMGALSGASVAISEDGTPSLQVSDIIAGGGIESTLSDNLLNAGGLHANASGLKDPFADMTPPSSPTPRTYSCPTTTTTTVSGSTTADVKTVVEKTYTYWQGQNQVKATTQVTYADAKDPVTTSTTATNQSVADGTTEGSSQQVFSSTTWTGSEWDVSGSTKEKIYEKVTEVRTEYYTNVTGATTSSTSGGGSMLPGTYGDINITCNTHFAPGVYIITGTFDLGQNRLVTGDDVMFVLTGSGTEKFKLNSNSKVVMSGITKSTLMTTYGLSDEEATPMAGMLIYDPNSTADLKINGGADMMLEGIVYTPKRTATFNGNSAVAGKCMMIAAGKITFSGSNQLGSFCKPSGVEAFDIGGTTVQVRLVA